MMLYNMILYKILVILGILVPWNNFFGLLGLTAAFIKDSQMNNLLTQTYRMQL